LTTEPAVLVREMQVSPPRHSALNDWVDPSFSSAAGMTLLHCPPRFTHNPSPCTMFYSWLQLKGAASERKMRLDKSLTHLKNDFILVVEFIVNKYFPVELAVNL